MFRRKQSGVLSVFYTAGFPKLEDTVSIAVCLEKAGVDLIEIGIPFSDPIADGPTIQESNKIALENGMTVKLLLKQVREVREQVNIPVILMGYLNPVMQYGVEKFLTEASAAGADGVILPDMPFDEYVSVYQPVFEKTGLFHIFLVSPTTSEARIRKIDGVSRGFIYAVSSSSTTGKQGEFTEEQVTYFKRLQGMGLKNPFLVGFGISNASTYETTCTYGAGAIVGSAFIRALQKSGNLEKDIEQFIGSIRGVGVA